jgi:hypothetical protein
MKMLRNWFFRFSLVACLAAANIMPSCSTPGLARSSASADPGGCSPVRIAIMQDKTGSAGRTRTPQLSVSDLTPLMELLQSCGGEIGFGLIRDNNNNSLLRLRTEAPPREPVAAIWDSNRFRAAQQKVEYSKKEKDYEKQRAAWLKETQCRQRDFNLVLKTLVETRVDAPLTDIWGALRQADVFLAESDASWGMPTSRWVVLVSDGEQTSVVTKPLALQSGAQMAVVNGSGLIGVLARFKPLAFGSPAAAFRHIIAVSIQKN